MRKGLSLQQMVLGNWITTCRKMKWEPHPTLLTKINTKQIKDLNIRPDTTTILRENIGRKLLDIGVDNEFFICY